MAKEILLYGYIYQNSSSEFINSIDAVSDSEGIDIRINSEGGNVDYGWGMIAKFLEYKGEKNIKVDGLAGSMAAIFVLFADKVEALDVSSFVFHRASYGAYYEKEYMSDAELKFLNMVNSSMEKALRAKVDVAKFEKEAGITIDEMFSMDGRLDVILTSKQAKKIGLIDSITTITPKKKSEIQNTYQRIAAHYNPAATIEVKEEVITKTNKMTFEEFKKANPEAAAAMTTEVSTNAVTAERDRVGALMAYIGVDKEAIIKAVKEGTILSQTMQAEFNVKMQTATIIKKVEGDNADDIVTEIPAAELTEEQKISAKMDAELK